MTDLREALAQLADGVETVLSEPPFDALINTAHLSYRLKVAREALAAVPEPEYDARAEVERLRDLLRHFRNRLLALSPLGDEMVEQMDAALSFDPRPAEPEAWEECHGVGGGDCRRDVARAQRDEEQRLQDGEQ